MSHSARAACSCSERRTATAGWYRTIATDRLAREACGGLTDLYDSDSEISRLYLKARPEIGA